MEKEAAEIESSGRGGRFRSIPADKNTRMAMLEEKTNWRAKRKLKAKCERRK